MSQIWGRLKKKHWKRARRSYTEGFIIWPNFLHNFERKIESGIHAHRVRLKEIFLNFVKAKHTRRNFEGQLCPELKRVTEGGWTFLFKLANYQTITRTLANRVRVFITLYALLGWGSWVIKGPKIGPHVSWFWSFPTDLWNLLSYDQSCNRFQNTLLHQWCTSISLFSGYSQSDSNAYHKMTTSCISLIYNTEKLCW